MLPYVTKADKNRLAKSFIEQVRFQVLRSSCSVYHMLVSKQKHVMGQILKQLAISYKLSERGTLKP